jgi:glucose-6-phosphate isomerase
MSRPTPTTRSTAPAQGATERAAWKALAEHYQTVRGLHLRHLFADDPRRGERLNAAAAGIYLDYSKNRITDETVRLLVGLAEECDLRERTAAMFRGERINVTEKRAVLHTARRAPETEQILVDGVDVVPGVHALLERMAAFSRQVRSGAWQGYTGKRIRHVINIGIGGSDLGPVMATSSISNLRLRALQVPNE